MEGTCSRSHGLVKLHVESRPLEFQKVDPSFYVIEIYSNKTIFAIYAHQYLYPVTATYKN